MRIVAFVIILNDLFHAHNRKLSCYGRMIGLLLFLNICGTKKVILFKVVDEIFLLSSLLLLLSFAVCEI